MTGENQNAIVIVGKESGTHKTPPIIPPVNEALSQDALRYLAHLQRSTHRDRAQRRAQVTDEDLEAWRLIPAFVELEDKAGRVQTSVTLARLHFQANALPVAEQITTDALNASHARDRTTAGIAVLKASGVISDSPGQTIAIQVNAGADAYHRALRRSKPDVSIDKPHA